MPPRFSYWTILAGGLPTAFRATDRDELLPTFQRLREKHPDAVLKWFARGRLWESPDEARADLERKRRPSGWHRDRPQGASSTRGPRRDGVPGGQGQEKRDRGVPGGQGQEKRDRSWRPGGEHRDPRQKFADAKKARNAALRKQRFERKHGGPTRPHGAPPHAKPFHAARGPRPARQDRDRFDGRPRNEGERRPPPHPGTDRRAEGKPGGAHGDRRPFTTGTRNPKPGAKDRYRPDTKPGGHRAFDRPAFGRNRETQARDTTRHGTPAPKVPPDRPKAPPDGADAAGAPPRRERDERKRRFPRS